MNTTALTLSVDLVDLVEQAGGELVREGKTWRGACPLHGGDNRQAFVIFPGESGKQMWSCFTHCGSGDAITFVEKWQDLDFLGACHYLAGELPNDPQQMAELAAIRIERARQELEQQIVRAQALVTDLKSTEVWLCYHANLQSCPEARAIWSNRGIPESWQDYWLLGYDSDHRFWSHQGETHSPTLTIPIHKPIWDCVNIRHRVLGDATIGRYRPEVSGLPPMVFWADPEQEQPNRLLVVEGEIKAMVARITMDDPSLTVIGMMGKNSQAAVLKAAEAAEQITILLDPDANAEALSLAHALGPKRSRIARLATKVDDAINEGLIDQRSLRRIIRDAAPVEAFR